MGQKRKKLFAGLAVGAFVILSLMLCYFAGAPILRFAADPDKFRAWVAAHGAVGKLAYIGMVVLQIVAAFIPGEPLEIAAGYAFGAVEGTLLCLFASALGSFIVIWLVRRFGMKLVEVFFSREKIDSLKFLKSSPRRSLLFLMIFMIPGTPKDLLCYFAGLTDIKLAELMLICSFGRIPSIITSTLGGDALGTESYILAIGVFALTLVISGLGLWSYNRLCVKHRTKAAGREEAAAKANGQYPAAEDRHSA